MKLDVHNHAIPLAAIRLLQSDPAYRVTTDGRHWSGGNHVDFAIAESFVDPAAKLEQLSTLGLDGAVISPAPPLFYYDADIDKGEAMSRAVNTGLSEFCEFNASRLHWMAHVPMRQPDRAVKVLEEARSRGCVGVEVATSIAGRRLDEPDFDVFWSAADEMGITVMIHPGYNASYPGLRDFYLDNVIGNLLETTVAIERLISTRLLDRYPRLRILLVHGGGFFPYGAGRLRHAISVRPELSAAPTQPMSNGGRLFFDTVTHDTDTLRFLVTMAGAESVVVGTDLPFDMATPDPIGELGRAVNNEIAALIAEHNPDRLFELSR
jgi:aminocarboxymuconate-semialdehyde decarboxylase